MPALRSFSTEVTEPFFTFPDHLREWKRTLSEASLSDDAADEITRSTADLLKTFLNIPNSWRCIIESTAMEITGRLTFRKLIDHATGELFHPERDPSVNLWDASLALPAVALDCKHSHAWRFGTDQGFGIPVGPCVTFFDPEKFTPADIEQPISTSKIIRSPEADIGLIAVLGRIIQDLDRRGMEALRRETAYKAAVLDQAIMEHPLLEAVTKRARRSPTLLVIRTDARYSDALAGQLSRFKLLPGRKGDVFSFTNFPTHSKESAEMLADCLSAFRTPD